MLDIEAGILHPQNEDGSPDLDCFAPLSKSSLLDCRQNWQDVFEIMGDSDPDREAWLIAIWDEPNSDDSVRLVYLDHFVTHSYPTFSKFECYHIIHNMEPGHSITINNIKVWKVR